MKSEPPTRSLARLAQEAWLPLAVIASLVAACVLASHRKPLANDELQTQALVSWPSVLGLINMVAHGADVVPPLHHVTAWLWGSVFGTDAISLRLLTAFGFAVAVVATWFALRGAFSWRESAVGLVTFFCGSQLLLFQVSEARFYGLLTALVALALLCFARVEANPAPSRRLLALQALSHAALVWCHIYGFLYSGAFLAAFIVSDIVHRRARWRVYASIATGWLTYAFWVPSLIRQAALARPRPMYPKPGPFVVETAYTFELAILPIVLLAIGFLIAFGNEEFSPERLDAALQSRTRNRNALLLGASALLMVPVVAVAISIVAVPIYAGGGARYCLPVGLAVAVFVAFLVTMAANGERAAQGRTSILTPAWTRRTWGALIVTLLLFPIGWAQKIVQFEAPVEPLPYKELNGVPVVVESLDHFTVLEHYKPFPGDYHFLLDQPIAYDPKNAQQAAAHDNLMRVWKHYQVLPHLDEWARFRCDNRRFAVIDDPYITWLQERIETDPVYTVRDLGPLTKGSPHRVVLVVASDHLKGC